MSKALLDRAGLADLLVALERRGFALVGPKVAGTAITYQPIASVDDLPRGCASAQSAGRYRLAQRDDDRMFAYGPAVESLKRFLRPPVERLWTATRRDGTLQFEPRVDAARQIAVIGARPCELAAIARLDAVFLGGTEADPAYRARRDALFLVAANCTDPGDTCFCASMGTGPSASAPFDLALTELSKARFIVATGSARGAELLAALRPGEVPPDAIDEERAALARAADHMGREVATESLPAALAAAFQHREWEDAASRCLACANCTIVCPTCFCHTIDDRTSLAGDHVERERRWDSCFGADFSYIHGGSTRPSVAARYRQWVTHKFSTWTEQFGTFGCVGCGRCITWCPAGIDVTEEIRRLRESPPS